MIYTSTTDGKEYGFRLCFCGKQNSAGICEHIKDPVIVIETPSQNGYVKSPLVRMADFVGKEQK